QTVEGERGRVQSRSRRGERIHSYAASFARDEGARAESRRGNSETACEIGYPGPQKRESARSTIMWKWVGGCLVVVLVVIGIGVYNRSRKLSVFSGPNEPETVAIGAPVSRVFASIANADSLSSWMAERMGVRASRHGMLVPGDTLQVGANMRFN